MMRETIYLEITLDRPEGPDKPRRDAKALTDAVFEGVLLKCAELHPRVDLVDIREADEAA